MSAQHNGLEKKQEKETNIRTKSHRRNAAINKNLKNLKISSQSLPAPISSRWPQVSKET
jgi:hypothetical protein